MMKRAVILLGIMILLTTPFTAAQPITDFKKTLQQASFLAEELYAGNINYPQFQTKLKDTQNLANSFLSQKSKEAVTKEQLTELLGDTDKKTSWITTDYQETEIAISESLPVWKNTLFDKSIYLEYQLFPVQDLNKEIYYQIKFNYEFKDEMEVNLKNEINNIEILAKTHVLQNDLQTLNNLAESVANIKALFADYSAQNPDSCEKIMGNILGQEYKKGQMEILGQEYKVLDQEDIAAYVTLTSCENCEGAGVRKWIDLDGRIEQQGNSLAYSVDKEAAKEQLKDAEENELKKAIIEANKLINEFGIAGNYKLIYSAMKTRLEPANDRWDEIANENQDETARLLNFQARMKFYKQFWADIPSKTTTSTQTIFEKSLFEQLKEGGEEICDNDIDDNDNKLIDCEEELCNGQVCGVRTLTSTENNETTNRTITLYCIAGECQLKPEETKTTPSSVCGNKICEDNEYQTCREDCIECPTYSPIDCNGKVLFKGTDANGCALEPICVGTSKICITDNDCEQPLCGKAQCVEGSCQVINQEKCKSPECFEGEEKVQVCTSNEKIVTEICTESTWKKTGYQCPEATNPETTVEKDKSNFCKSSKECKEGLVCSNNECKSVARKTSEATTVSSTTEVKGVSFTGEVVQITGDLGSITTNVEGKIESPQELEQYKQIQKPEQQTGRSFLTGVSREENVITIFETEKREKETIPSELQEQFYVRGSCIENPTQTIPVLDFGGGGEMFDQVLDLVDEYEKDGTQGYCSWELANRLKERKAFIEGAEYYFNWFTEDYFYSSATDLEGKSQALINIHEKNIQNILGIAEAMKCLNMRQLEETSLVNIEKTSENVHIIYKEKLVNIQGVQIPSPSLEFTFTPDKEVYKQELIEAMNNFQFVGSSKNIAERNRGEGLTPEEYKSIFEDKELAETIKSMANRYKDGSLNFLISVKDEQENIIYNLYGKMSATKIMVQAMPIDKAPATDIKIEIPYEKYWDLTQSSKQVHYKENKYSPLDSGFKPLKIIENTFDLISLRTKLNALTSNIKVTPERSSGEIKDLAINILDKITSPGAEESVKIKDDSQKQEVWSAKGTKIASI